MGLQTKEDLELFSPFCCCLKFFGLAINSVSGLLLWELGAQWLMPVILATREAEMRRIPVQCQAQWIVLETLPRKYPSEERWRSSSGKALLWQVWSPEFKPWYYKKLVWRNKSDLAQLQKTKPSAPQWRQFWPLVWSVTKGPNPVPASENDWKKEMWLHRL
jgi:hypothetical protein